MLRWLPKRRLYKPLFQDIPRSRRLHASASHGQQKPQRYSKNGPSKSPQSTHNPPWMHQLQTVEKVLGRSIQKPSGRLQLERALVSCASNGLFEEGTIVVDTVFPKVQYELSPRAYAAALICCARTCPPIEGQTIPEAIPSLFDRMQQTNGAVESHFLDRMMMHLVEFKGYRTALATLQYSMEDLHVDIGEDVHAHVATVSAQEGVDEWLLQPVLDSMKRRGIPPSVECYNAILSDAQQRLEWEDVEKTLQDMQENNVGPNSETLKCLTFLAQKCSVLDRFVEIRDKLEDRRVTVDPSTSALLVKFWTDNEMWDRAAKEGMNALKGAFDGQPAPSLQAGNGTVDMTMFDSLLHALVQKGDADEAIQIWTRIMHMDNVTRHLSTSVFEDLIRLLAQKEMWSAAVDVHSIMLQRKRTASDEIVEKVTDACKLMSNYDHMQRMIFYQIAEGLPVTKELANSFLASAASLVPDQLQRLVRMLSKRNVDFDLDHVFRGLLEKGNIEAASTIFTSLGDLKIENRLTVDIQQLAEVGRLTMHAAYKTGKHGSTASIIETIIGIGDSSSESLMQEVLDMCFATGQNGLATRVILSQSQRSPSGSQLDAMVKSLINSGPTYVGDNSFQWIQPVKIPDEGEPTLLLWERFGKTGASCDASTITELIKYNVMIGRPWTVFRVLAALPSPTEKGDVVTGDGQYFNRQKIDPSAVIPQDVIQTLSAAQPSAGLYASTLLGELWNSEPWKSISGNPDTQYHLPFNARISPPVPFFPVLNATEHDGGMSPSFLKSRLSGKKDGSVSLSEAWAVPVDKIKEFAEEFNVDIVDYRSLITRDSRYRIPFHKPNDPPRKAVVVNEQSDLRTISKMPEIDGSALFKQANQNSIKDFKRHQEELTKQAVEATGRVPFLRLFPKLHDAPSISIWGDKILDSSSLQQQWKETWTARLATIPIVSPQYSFPDYTAHLLWNVARFQLPLSPPACDNILKECVQHDVPSLAMLLFALMQQQGVGFYDITSYERALDLCIESEVPELALWALASMANLSQVPSLVQLDNLTRLNDNTGRDSSVLKSLKKAAELLLNRER
eukprot:gb/GECG01002221.1/.p1 GENE.gb/GECG01002221.1/~~gb/GECG01002221.1/.p1  ORF type:complete len:1072 (+),score=127.84 gb/GECG01002221.1/:1-3216(+)